MISSKYGCASPEQNTRETPSNLLSSDDERVPVELIRVAFIKKSVLRSPISELLFLISTSVATNINFQILKATFWHTIGQLFGNFVAQCGFPSCGIYSSDYESYNLVPRVISYSSLPGWPGAWLLSLHNRIDYFPIAHNTLCLPSKFCITYCLKMLLGKCNTPRSI